MFIFLYEKYFLTINPYKIFLKLNFYYYFINIFKIDYPDVTGFSPRNLARMRKFYETYKGLANLPPAAAKIPWTHNSILVERVNDSIK